MKNYKFPIVFSILCFVFITIALLFFTSNISLIFVIVMGLTAIVFQKFVHRGSIRELGYRWTQWRWIVYAMIFPLGILMVSAGIDFIAGWIQLRPLEEMVTVLIIPSKKMIVGALMLSVLLQWILTFMINFISEELAFRGYLITRFRFLGARKAVVISAMIFGLWHLPVSVLLIHGGWLRMICYVVNISLLGILFGWLFLRSNSLIPSCLAHGLWNALEYTFWGMGNANGIFTGKQRVLFDPEEGVAGLIPLFLVGIFLLSKHLVNKKKGEHRDSY